MTQRTPDERPPLVRDWSVPQSWAAAATALVIEACVALVLGVWVGHPRPALATALWGLPVFVYFIPLGGARAPIDEVVLGVGGPDQDRRTAVLNLEFLLAIVVPWVV